MTATETPAEAHEEVDEHHAADPVPSSGDGLYRLIASNDHKDVGRMWIAMSLIFFVALGGLGVLNEFERLDTDPQIWGSVSRAFQGWVLFRTGAIFMVVIPIFIGIATVVTPLQVGSASIAFPRLAAASFWAWLFAAIVHIISFVADGGLGPAQTTSVQSTALTMTSLSFMIIALLGASVAIATTIVALRPTGMTLIDVPAFSWSMLVACSIWLLSLPVLISNMILIYVDLQGRPAIDLGNGDLIWARVEWAWSQPQVFAYAIPVLGVLADVIPTQTKSRQAGRPVLLGFIGVFGVLSFGAWAQSFWSKFPAFIYEEVLYSVFAFAILLPAFLAFSGAMDQIRRGSFPKPGGALLGSVFGALLLLDAVALGIARVSAAVVPLLPFADLEPNWVSIANEEGVLLASSTGVLIAVIAAAMASALGALVHWAPKIFGGFAVEPLAALGAMMLLAGGVAAGVANVISAFDGQADDIRFVESVDGLTASLNLVSMIGLAALAGGAVLMILSVLPARSKKETISDDPWGGQTLEWATPSPPPIGNFVEPVGVVRSPEPLLDELEEVN